MSENLDETVVEGRSLAAVLRQVAAGRASFKARQAQFQAYCHARGQLYKEAHQLVEEWDELINAYMALLGRAASADLERDRAYGQIRERLAAFVFKLEENPSIMALLQEAGAEIEFGLWEPTTLRRLLSAPLPTQALALLLETIDRGTGKASISKSDRPAEQLAGAAPPYEPARPASTER